MSNRSLIAAAAQVEAVGRDLTAKLGLPQTP